MTMPQTLAMLLGALAVGLVPTLTADAAESSSPLYPVTGTTYELSERTRHALVMDYDTEILSLGLTAESTSNPANLAEIVDGDQFVVDSFFDVFFEVKLGDNGGGVEVNHDVPVRITGIRDTTGLFQTEMVSMSLSGNVGGINYQVRIDPNTPSTGQLALTQLPGGEFEVDSFFDVWFEFSFDGGTSWQPYGTPNHVVLTQIPEPASLALLGLGGLVALRRRR